MRRKTVSFKVRDVGIGSDYPITVQSMTNTDSLDVDATLAQVIALAEAGADIMRVAIPHLDAVESVCQVAQKSPIPIVGDIHFDYRIAIAAIENGIDAVRINPGNIGGEEKFSQVIEQAKHYDVPMRIGVNSGSIEKDILAKYGHPCVEAMVESLVKYVRFCEERDFYKLVLSVKSSDVTTMIAVNKKAAEVLPYPIHLGVTEAGTVQGGTIKSAIGIGALLSEGIGDTIRVSLTGNPINEIPVAEGILRALHLREKGADVIACPTCGRTKIALEDLAKDVEVICKDIKKPLKVAVMGCVVNGPGEAKEADIGIAGGIGSGIIFKKGEVVRRCDESELLVAFEEELQKLLNE